MAGSFRPHDPASASAGLGPPPEEAAPGAVPLRVVAFMVGLVAILLLGSLFWSAMGALIATASALVRAIPSSQPAPATPTAVAAVVVTPATPAPPTATPLPTVQPTSDVAPSATPTVAVTAAGRRPWVLLPQPAPGARVSAGSVTVEARGRGDAPIAEIRLELDGTPLTARLDQRSDVIWRAQASASVSAGQHAVLATVVDAAGRTGSYRWSFEAAPP